MSRIENRQVARELAVFVSKQAHYVGFLFDSGFGGKTLLSGAIKVLRSVVKQYLRALSSALRGNPTRILSRAELLEEVRDYVSAFESILVLADKFEFAGRKKRAREFHRLIDSIEPKLLESVEALRSEFVTKAWWTQRLEREFGEYLSHD